MDYSTTLVYIANARLPTERAHGYQIMKMCEAFAQAGAEVMLLHPYRHQPNVALAQADLFEWYSIPRLFQVKTLSNFDIVRFKPLTMAGGLTQPLFAAHDLLWGRYAAAKAASLKASLYYTRDIPVAYWLLRRGLPTVLEAHVVPRRLQRWMLRRMAQDPNLQFVVVITSFIKEQFADMGFPSEKVEVLADSVDISLFEHLPTREECRRQLGLPLDSDIIGYVGRFQTMEMEKGLAQLVEMMPHLPSMNGRTSCLMCIGGPLDAVPQYLRLASNLGVPESRLKFLDRVPNKEVPYWIRACDVVTIPFPFTQHYAYFASPMKLFEYMAAEVPIVASDLPSLREVLQHGVNAWLVEPGDPRALAEGISRVLSSKELSKSLAHEARQTVNRYTWKRRAQAILERVR